jgi:Cdc6-like AAA superfamily ATPase
MSKESKLRTIIQESLRVQRGSAEQVAYIDTGNVLSDVCARQNHVIFARRGCGKTLLLHYSARQLREGIHSVYLNCEDFKRHSFPNVLIEILDALFAELEKHLSAWFGRKKRSRELIKKIRTELAQLQNKADQSDAAVKATSSAELGASASAELGSASGLKALAGFSGKSRDEIEKVFKLKHNKLEELDRWLPRLKKQIREFFEVSDKVSAIYLQIDDLYQLRQDDQPFVVDYIHRLCKDLPLFFKIATLRHASVLFVDVKDNRSVRRKGTIFNQ